MGRDPVRGSPGRGGFPDPILDLPAQTGPVRRDSPDPGVHPRGPQGAQSCLPDLQNQLAKARRRGDRPLARTLRRRMVSLPSADPDDPGYRRLRYCRYADDHLLGFAGPKAEAEKIKQRLAEFLRDELKLDLSQDKTLIPHARTGVARE